MKKIGLVGALGTGEPTSSGQIIRTNILNNELQNYYGQQNIFVVNTSIIRNNPIKFIGRLLLMTAKCDDIIVILSINGILKLWPIFSRMSRVLKKRIYNNVIGGNLLSNVVKYPKFVDYMKSFTINWVQSKKMIDDLKVYGINNVEWLPNSKPIKILDETEFVERNGKPYRFCTFSRVSKAKGVELAADAIKEINEAVGKTVAELVIYGNPDDDYRETFYKYMENSPEYVSYGGVVDFDKSVNTLKDYYMLLFPTTFNGEGFPGTVIDAYASGTPVIASDWSCNPEFIEEGKTGFLYPFEQPTLLKEKILWTMEHPEEVEQMRYSCLKEAAKYTPDIVYRIIFDRIKNESNK